MKQKRKKSKEKSRGKSRVKPTQLFSLKINLNQKARYNSNIHSINSDIDELEQIESAINSMYQKIDFSQKHATTYSTFKRRYTESQTINQESLESKAEQQQQLVRRRLSCFYELFPFRDM